MNLALMDHRRRDAVQVTILHPSARPGQLTLIAAICVTLSLPFTPLALSAQPSWFPTGGPGGGVVSSLVLDGKEQIFASTLERGVFLSRNRGNSWVSVSATLPVREIRAMVVRDEDLYVGTGTGHVFKSPDREEDWSLIAHFPFEIHALAVDSRARIFAGTGGGGVFRIENDDTWAETGLKEVSVQCLASGSDGEIYAGTNLGLFVTADGGDSWQSIELPDIYVFSLAVDRKGTLFAGTWAGRVYRSRPGEGAWTVMNVGPENSVIWNLSIDEKGRVLAAATGGGVFRSTDDGIHWEPMNNGLTDLSVRSLAVSPAGVVYAGTASGTVFRTSPPTPSVSSHKPASGLSQFFGIR